MPALRFSVLPRLVSASLFVAACLPLFLLLSLPSSSAASSAAAQSSSLPAKECEALGFTGLALCSDCDQLAAYVKDEKLESECRSCCVVDDEDTSAQKYSSAVLEVCMRRVAYMPVVAEFVETKAKEYGNLKVRYRMNALPKLIMKDEEGKDADIIRIENWKLEHIEQFLREKLAGKPTSAAA